MDILEVLGNDDYYEFFNSLEGRTIAECRTPSYEESQNGYDSIIFIIVFTDGAKMLVTVDENTRDLAFQLLNSNNEVLEEENWEI